MLRCSLLIMLGFSGIFLHGGETITVNDAGSFNRAVVAARPGDKIALAPGEYGNNFYFRNIHGTAKEPILIVAADPKMPPRLTGRNAPLQLGAVSYLEISDLLITGSAGNGLNIDDGGDAKKPSHHITLRNIQVRDIGPKGNRDGIKLSGVDDFKVEGCTIERWGSGGSGIDMVGCHRGTIEGCSFRQGGANAVQTKGGSSEIMIRKCLFREAGERGVNLGGSTGDAYFRPPLSEFPASGKYEAKDIVVEGCTFVGGGAPVAFVGVDGAKVRFNTFYHPGRYVIRILQEKSDEGFVPSRKGTFESNIVLFRSDSWVTGGVNIGSKTAPDSFSFANNLWYCEDRPERSAPKLPTVEKNGLVGKNPQFLNPAKGDFQVHQGSPASDRGAHALPKR
jgi:hypothetical protein